MGRLTGTAVQGSNDAFVQQEMATALTGQTRQAYQVREIAVQLPKVTNSATEFTVALSRRSKTSMPTLSDIDVMWINQFGIHLTTSGATRQELVQRYQPPETLPIIIVEDPIYLCVDSTATSASNTVIVIVEYEIVQISEVERLNIIAQSLLSA